MQLFQTAAAAAKKVNAAATETKCGEKKREKVRLFTFPANEEIRGSKKRTQKEQNCIKKLSQWVVFIELVQFANEYQENTHFTFDFCIKMIR